MKDNINNEDNKDNQESNKDKIPVDLLSNEEEVREEGTYNEEGYLERGQKEFDKFFSENSKAKQAYDILLKTSHSLVVTGHDNEELLRFIKVVQAMMFRTLPLALTKSGATIIEGSTIHSTLKLPIEFVLPDDEQLRKISFSKDRYHEDFFWSQLIIISEISMISPVMLDCINVLLQQAKGNKDLFGGCRLLFIGDCFQLPPIVHKLDRINLLKHYENDHFSESKAFKELNPLMIDIGNIALTNGDSLASCLEKIRKHKDITTALEVLNTRFNEIRIPVYDLEIDPGIIVCFDKADAHSINQSKFYKLKTDLLTFDAEVTGKFEWGNLKIQERLELREGTRVMLTKSQQSEAYPFGTLGYISTLTPDKIIVTPDVGEAFEVEPEKWYTTKREYTRKKKELVTKDIEVGTMTQYPLVHAWAISLHQSHGQTFENVYLYDSNGWFFPMKRYAALSRARSLEGLTLHKKLVLKDFKRNKNASKFSTAVKREKRINQILKSIKE